MAELGIALVIVYLRIVAGLCVSEACPGWERVQGEYLDDSRSSLRRFLLVVGDGGISAIEGISCF